MADKDDQKEKEPELEIVEVDDEGKPLAPGGQAAATEGASAEAEKPEADEDDEHDDERLKLGQDDPEQRKKDRATKAEKRRQARLRDQRELALLKQQNEALAQRLAAIETHTGRQDLTLVDDRIANAKKLVQQADQVIADAITKQDGKRCSEAMKVRDDARDQVVQLSSLKVQLEHRARAEAPSPQHQQSMGLAPAIAQRVQAFQQKHPWYDAAGRDTDSGVIQRLDQAVADEGYDPASPDYWDELEKRAAKYLPHRFEAGTRGNGQQQRRSGPPMNGGGDGGSITRNGKVMVKISPARKQAMIEAGAWDDAAKRQRMLKAYEKYDRENPPQRQQA